MNEVSNPGTQWFYEDSGKRVGPISENQLIELAKSSRVSGGTSVWKQGFPDWKKLEETDLHIHLSQTEPPPLIGDHINNTIVWVLAFAPIIGYFLEWIVAGVLHSGNEYAMESAMASGKYWFITLIINIALAFFDENLLRKAGHDTKNFKGWTWIVPVYLYQRAKATKQNQAYFIVWLICFAVILLG